MPVALQIPHPEMTRFVEPQPAPIHRHQKGPVARLVTTHREELFQLLDAEYLRPDHRLAAEGKGPPQRRQLPMRHMVIKKPKGIDRLVDRTRGPMPLHRQVNQIGVDFRLGQDVGWPPIVFGQMIDLVDVCFLGSLGQPAQSQFLDELQT